ncbi:MAG: chemotaxis response regulator protein-glutamate methylesterase [Spirochaetales bacterium]|jgi:two-component system chemotaxis response regulator CheB|nr:chemotaxis response regulator protein-glutamate methylesterase [Spirochaetales bacterium]
MDEEKISVLICDDSALMRNLISRMVESDPHLMVAGKAMNGRFALDKLPTLKPDIIVMDLEMPEMSGIEFLKERKRLGITIPVIILSAVAQRGAQITMEAMELGAQDFILKPSTGSQELMEVQKHLTDTLKAYGARYKRLNFRTKEVPGAAAPAAPPAAARPLPEHAGVNESFAYHSGPPPVIQRAALTRQIDVVALGISTGGPNALREVFPMLDPELPVPFLVVQHMPAGFTKEFAASLNRICPLEVKEAEEGDLLKPGRVLIAPGDSHLEVEQKKLAVIAHLTQAPLRSGHRPSADVLFESVAKAYGGRALAVIMTGMGKDGATEIGKIYQAGGITIAQDQESAVVYGMPRAAFENGYTDHVVSLDKIAPTINRIVRENQR